MEKALAVDRQYGYVPLIIVDRGVRFQKLSLDGINPNVTQNPVIKMLIQGDAILASGRRCTIVPEDEMLIFLD